MWYEAKREFIEAAARVMWAGAWADWQESRCAVVMPDGQPCGRDQEGIDGDCADAFESHDFKGASFSGQELTEIAPPTPQYALYEAAGLLARLEVANGAGLAAILAKAGEADDLRNTIGQFMQADASAFGSDIALQAVGHGVSWFDDHAKFELKVPSIEFEYIEEEE